MNLKSAINKFSGHLKTVSSHRRMVFYHARRVGIPVQGLLHDLSKYSPSEFLVGVRYFVGNKSPNEGERLEYGYSKAWLHHKGRNRHHLEYWIDYKRQPDGTVRLAGMPMPKKYVVEMFCDRLAASRVYKGKDFDPAAPYRYYMHGKAANLLHEESAALLETLLVILKDEGEDSVFRYIREEVLD